MCQSSVILSGFTAKGQPYAMQKRFFRPMLEISVSARPTKQFVELKILNLVFYQVYMPIPNTNYL